MAKKTTLVIVMLLVIASLAFGEPVTYVVQKGDTLYGIAKKFGVSVDAIVSLNGIKDPSRVLPGTKLVMPVEPTPTPAAAEIKYVVQKGDTLYSIAKRFGITVQEIVALNSLGSTTIKPDQTLSLPGAKGAVSGGAAPATTATPAPTPVSIKPAASERAETGTWPAAGELSFLQGKLKGVAIGVKAGTAISAIRSGTVVSAGPFRSFGQVAFVQSSDGLVYVYGGASALKVRVGDSIRKGAILGLAEADEGGSAYVYFFVFKGADSMDPAAVPRD